MHCILKTQVGVRIGSEGHAHEHPIQNSRKPLNNEVETLLVGLKQLLLQLVFEFGAAIELTDLWRVMVLRYYITRGILLLFTRLRVDLGQAVLFVNQSC